MYEKNFDKWNNEKQHLNHREDFRRFKEGDIWWVSFGVNVGFEIDGKNNGFERPALVLKKINYKSAYIVPLTSTVKEENTNFIPYEIEGIRRSANISQVRMVDTRRFRRRAKFKMTVKDFVKIKLAFISLIK